MSEQLTIKPYARLITMLGDQLITDETVALIEIIKNSYDADAANVWVNFVNFDADFSAKPDSRIIICDDGVGMNEDVIRNSWMNPASMDKLQRKRASKARTRKGRYIQGEKGIGRFAIFKLGFNVVVSTSPEEAVNKDTAYRLRYAFDEFGLDFLSGNEPMKLEDIRIPFDRVLLNEQYCGSSSHGTKIEISSLKGGWGEKKVREVVKAVAKIRPLFDMSSDAFDVVFLRDGKRDVIFPTNLEDKRTELKELIESKAVFRISDGTFFSQKRCFVFRINGEEKSFSIQNSNVGKKQEDIDALTNDSPYVGDFHFSFYIFDLSANQVENPQYYLSKAERLSVKENRVYLYRDSIRVLPYGDSDDDWLQIDVSRGLEKAGSFFSNDQIVGQISITGEENPHLSDKTSREGLVDDGRAKRAFISLIKLFLHWIKIEYYDKYKIIARKAIEEKNRKNRRTLSLVEEMANELSNQGHPELAKKLQVIGDSYVKDREWFEDKIEITERLAGIGLAVETGTHDIRLFLNRAIDKLYDIQLANAFSGNAGDDIASVIGNLTTVKSLLDNIDLLYPAAKNKERIVDLRDVVNVVCGYYKSPIAKYDIRVNVVQTSPLKVKCIDAVLIQALLNLFDNAFYWCKDAIGGGVITIRIDGDDGKMRIGDNGRGIQKNDVDYIFEAFFTRKGEDGRGLGLYIARQLLRRYGFELSLVGGEKNELFLNAEFEINFTEGAVNERRERS